MSRTRRKTLNHVGITIAIALGGILLASCIAPRPPEPGTPATLPTQKTASQPAANADTPEITPFVAAAIASLDTPRQSAVNSLETAASAGQIRLTTNKLLSVVKPGASESPRDDGIHDLDNDALTVLQDPNVAMKDFPRDRRQQVDWVKALDQGHIAPRADLLGNSEMTLLDLDIMMKNTQFMPWVKFPHLRHTRWLACSNCHPAIFEAKENANPITMNKVLRGEYCGVCHDKVAFALFTCERCHSVPHEGSGPKWW
ncbi:MAG: hypothetical protein GXP17_03150 [Gammaproteobacteria bacterium]|nr:hypothetical protein [Gammaproteobacteria bacterium]